jgi:hypothetical protein
LFGGCYTVRIAKSNQLILEQVLSSGDFNGSRLLTLELCGGSEYDLHLVTLTVIFKIDISAVLYNAIHLNAANAAADAARVLDPYVITGRLVAVVYFVLPPGAWDAWVKPQRIAP